LGTGIEVEVAVLQRLGVFAASAAQAELELLGLAALHLAANNFDAIET